MLSSSQPLARRMLPLVLAWTAGAAHAAVPQAQIDWLAALYNQTDGPHWSNHTNWGSGDPCANAWEGVVCAGGVITELRLSNHNLAGTLPATPDWAAVFTDLELIDLSRNKLQGAVPAVSGMPKLKTLRLYDNAAPGFQSSLPAVANTPALETVSAYNSGFTGAIPALVNLPNLAAFNARNNQLTGSIPDLTALPSLTYFAVNDNLLNGTINSPTLSNLLGTFRIHNNQLTGRLPPAPAAAGSGYILCANHLESDLDPVEEAKWNQLTGSNPADPWYKNCTYTVTPSAGAQGGISPATPQAAAARAQTTFTITTVQHYLVDAIGGTCMGTITGASQAGGIQTVTYQTTAASKDCTVAASFRRDPAAPPLPSASAAIPTLGEWALALLGLLLASVAAVSYKKNGSSA